MIEQTVYHKFVKRRPTISLRIRLPQGNLARFGEEVIDDGDRPGSAVKRHSLFCSNDHWTILHGTKLSDQLRAINGELKLWNSRKSNLKLQLENPKLWNYELKKKTETKRRLHGKATESFKANQNAVCLQEYLVQRWRVVGWVFNWRTPFKLANRRPKSAKVIPFKHRQTVKMGATNWNGHFKTSRKRERLRCESFCNSIHGDSIRADSFIAIRFIAIRITPSKMLLPFSNPH